MHCDGERQMQSRKEGEVHDQERAIGGRSARSEATGIWDAKVAALVLRANNLKALLLSVITLAPVAAVPQPRQDKTRQATSTKLGS